MRTVRSPATTPVAGVQVAVPPTAASPTNWTRCSAKRMTRSPVVVKLAAAQPGPVSDPGVEAADRGVGERAGGDADGAPRGEARVGARDERRGAARR